MEEIEIEIGGVKVKMPKAAADAIAKMQADMDAMRADMAKMNEDKPKLDSLKGENAGLKTSLEALSAEVKTLTDDLAAKRLDALKTELAQGLSAEQTAKVKSAKTPADAYRAALAPAVLARLDATVGDEGLRAAFLASRAQGSDAQANAIAQTQAPEGAPRMDAAPVFRFGVANPIPASRSKLNTVSR